MKSLNFSTIAFLFIAVLTLFSSCKKDKDVEVGPNIVGEWTVSDGTANVYQNGNLLADLAMTTFGTIEFNADGTGNSDFGIEIANEASEAKGPFTWEEDGFELLISKPNAEVERWARIDDEENLQIIQYTIDEDDNPNMEVELTLTFSKE